MTISDASMHYQEMALEDAMRSRCAFGKYSGRELATVPYSYLQWITINVRPLPDGADRVYRMIFAARKITGTIELPDSMPANKKYFATPADILAWNELRSVVPYRVKRPEGRWVIPNANTSEG